MNDPLDNKPYIDRPLTNIETLLPYAPFESYHVWPMFEATQFKRVCI